MSQPPAPHPDSKPVTPETLDEKDGDAVQELKPLSRWLWILIPLLLAFYPLSLGPVVLLVRSGAIPLWVVMSLEFYFYKPLILLCESSDVLTRLMRWYVDLWTL